MPEDADGVQVCGKCSSSNLREGTEYPFTEVKYQCRSCGNNWSEFDEDGTCKLEGCNDPLENPWKATYWYEKEGFCSAKCRTESMKGKW